MACIGETRMNAISRDSRSRIGGRSRLVRIDAVLIQVAWMITSHVLETSVQREETAIDGKLLNAEERIKSALD
jgi:hypothetical protein